MKRRAQLNTATVMVTIYMFCSFALLVGPEWIQLPLAPPQWLCVKAAIDKQINTDHLSIKSSKAKILTIKYQFCIPFA